MNTHKSNQSLFHMFGCFFQAYPKRTVVTVCSLFIASLFEGFGIAMLLPIMGNLVEGEQSSNAVSQAIEHIFNVINLPFNLPWLLSFLVFFIALKFVLSYLAMREVAKTAALVTSDMRVRLIRSLLYANWSYFTSLANGRASSAMSSEAERSSMAYLTMCIIISDLALISVYLVLALFVSWQVSAASIFSGLIIFMLTKKIVGRTKKAGRAQTKHLNNLLEKMSDSLSVVKPIKAMSRGKHYANILEEEVVQLQRSQIERFSNRELMRLIREPLIITILSFGLYFSVEHWGIELSKIMVLSILFLRMAMKVMNVQTNHNQLVDHESGFWSFQNLITDSEHAKDKEAGTHKPSLSKNLEIQNLSFEHITDTPVLKNINTTFDPYKFYALIGPSGSGKTTFIDLILGLYKPTNGDILLDGQSLNDIDIFQWRRKIGYVPQDCVLLNDSIFKNVTLGDETLSEEDAVRALKHAGAWEFIKDLEHTIHENVGEKGMKFSGGQRQRIAIARALVQQPLLLLFDEPSSALDKKTETLLMQTLQNISKDITLIVISHSDDVKKYADEILMLEHGQLSER